MNFVYIVRGEFESQDTAILGVYSTEARAQARCELIKASPDYAFKYVWYQVVDVDDGGGDCYLSS